MRSTDTKHRCVCKGGLKCYCNPPPGSPHRYKLFKRSRRKDREEAFRIAALEEQEDSFEANQLISEKKSLDNQNLQILLGLTEANEARIRDEKAAERMNEALYEAALEAEDEWERNQAHPLNDVYREWDPYWDDHYCED